MSEPSTHPAGSARAPGEATTAPWRARILLADDNPEIREHVRRLLLEHYEVEVAKSGEEALAAALARPPDLVLSDAVMPGLSGYGLVRELRADPRTRGTPAILFSARAGDDARATGLEAGADDYLIKPFSARELLTRVATHLEMARLRRDSVRRERELQEEAQAVQEHLAAVLAGISDSFVTLDQDWRCTFLNARAAELLDASPREIVGRVIWEVLPRLARSQLGEALRRARRQGTVTHRESYSRRRGRWFEHRIHPSPRGLSILTADITDRKRAEEAQRRAKESAEAANRAKDRFLATLSHELRTPLTPILAVTSALESDPALAAEVREQLTMVRRNVELEARLIDDLLDLTRITRGKLELNREPADLRAAIEHAIRTSREGRELSASELTLSASLEAASHLVSADVPRLIQVLWNLLNNAVKFTPSGGRIEVRSRSEGGQLVVEVADNGIGIEPEQLGRIFDAFEQGQPEIARNFGGLGLGLAISRALVELHGGSLAASSPGRGQGATFTIRLPLLERPGGPPPAAAPVADLPPPRTPSSPPPSSEAAANPARPPASPGRGAGPALHILLVEDHEDTAGAMASLLSRLGHRVTVAGCVAAARAVAEEAARGGAGIDLVLSDLGLPDGSGLDLMRELSSRYGLRGIALSGYGMEEDIAHSHEAGFARHLTKPINLRDLEEALRSVAGA